MRFTSAISTSLEYKFCSETCLVATLSRSKWAVKWRLTGQRDFPVELKTITGWGKCDIRNNQGLEKCYQLRPKHLPRPWPFQTSQKTNLKIVFLYTVLKKKTTNTSSHRTAFEIIHCSHNLEISQLPTRRQRSNLYVAQICKVNLRLLGNKKTDSEYNVS